MMGPERAVAGEALKGPEGQMRRYVRAAPRTATGEKQEQRRP